MPAQKTAVAGGSIISFPRDARRRRLVQLANDAYREWRQHCAQLTHAYGCWADADSSSSERAWEARCVSLNQGRTVNAMMKTSKKPKAPKATIGACQVPYAVSSEVATIGPRKPPMP